MNIILSIFACWSRTAVRIRWLSSHISAAVATLQKKKKKRLLEQLVPAVSTFQPSSRLFEAGLVLFSEPKDGVKGSEAALDVGPGCASLARRRFSPLLGPASALALKADEILIGAGTTYFPALCKSSCD